MKAKWLIENFANDPAHIELVQAVRDSGREVVVLDVTNHFEFKPERFTDGECMIYQGSIQLGKIVRDTLPKCHPGVYNSVDKFKATSYYSALGKHLFNDEYLMMTAAEVKRSKWFLYKLFGKEALIFVRPDSGDKTFSGRLLDLQDFDRFWTDITRQEKPEDILIVSTPKTIRGEWRFLVTSHHYSVLPYPSKIIGVSSYQYQGQRTYVPGAPVAATDKCLEILAEGYHPDSVYCIDICEDNDGKFWLMELTSFGSAGLYSMDKKKVVENVSAIAEFEWQQKAKK